jgi:hypothetical protein
MRKLTLAAVLIGAFLATGCKRPGSQKLSGHWRGQKADGIPDTAQTSADVFAKSTEIIAQGNQISIITPAGHPPAATYTVDKEDASTLVIHTDRDSTKETFAFSDKGATMVWKIEPSRSITFTKVK